MNSRLLLLSFLALAACGPAECKLTDAKSCSGTTVCERLVGQTRALCFQPVLVEGTVKVFGSATPIADAQVNAIDVAGGSAATATPTATDGTYSLRIHTTRTDEKGGYPARKITLSAAAKDFTPYPSSARPAPAIDIPLA